MAEYVKQHFLPAVYLQNFCVDTDVPSRRGTLWRFDGETSTPVRVENQCFENYCYSKTHAEGMEKVLAQTEGKYGLMMQRFRARQPLPGTDFSLLLAVMIDFHIRNTSYVNATGEEGVAAYNVRAANCGKLLVNRPTSQAEPTNDEPAAHLQKNWRVRILPGPASVPFCTSDNPSVWLTFSKVDPKLDLMILPLDPRHAAFAYDVRSWDVLRREISVQDAAHLNHLQCVAAQRFVYSHLPLHPDTAQAVARERQLRGRERGITSKTKFEVRLLHWPEARPSFLREAPVIL